MRIVVDNKLRGAYGEADLDKGVIRINKKRHYQKGAARITPAKDGHEKIHSTIQHELLHFKHPKKSETEIRKLEKKTVARMSAKQKNKLLGYLR